MFTGIPTIEMVANAKSNPQKTKDTYHIRRHNLGEEDIILFQDVFESVSRKLEEERIF